MSDAIHAAYVNEKYSHFKHNFEADVWKFVLSEIQKKELLSDAMRDIATIVARNLGQHKHSDDTVSSTLEITRKLIKKKGLHGLLIAGDRDLKDEIRIIKNNGYQFKGKYIPDDMLPPDKLRERIERREAFNRSIKWIIALQTAGLAWVFVNNLIYIENSNLVLRYVLAQESIEESAKFYPFDQNADLRRFTPDINRLKFFPNGTIDHSSVLKLVS